MRVLVCGGRDFYHFGVVNMVLSKYENEPNLVIIQGGAKGADFLAKAWADWRSIPCEEYPADWKQYGKRAGNIRNAQMLNEGKPDLVIAFRGGRGTADMVDKATHAGIKVVEVK